ncbi:hypothetical protein EC140385_05145 [Escherichia coli O145:H28]|nr:hypothetical protein EC140385_05145 [Escherichia coli O145:H28]
MLTHFRQELKALTGRKLHLKRIHRVIVIGITQGILSLIKIKVARHGNLGRCAQTVDILLLCGAERGHINILFLPGGELDLLDGAVQTQIFRLLHGFSSRRGR